MDDIEVAVVVAPEYRGIQFLKKIGVPEHPKRRR
jgi:hypothetical protein